MTLRKSQRGTVLIVSVIMLFVLTLFVISAIRSSNINLRVAGNMQIKEEMDSAAEVAIQSVIEDLKFAPDISVMYPNPGNLTKDVVVGGVTYAVKVERPKCLVSVPVPADKLSPADVNDLPCFESADRDKMFNANGTPTSFPSACNDQQILVQASVADLSSGATTNHVQGLYARVPAPTKCKD